MMSPYLKSVTQHPQCLWVVAHGERRSSLDVAEGTREYYRYIEQTRSRHVLLDYREVTFKNSVADAFNVIRLYEKMPLLKDVKMVAVVNSSTLPLAMAWKEFANARGFRFHFTVDVHEAQHWLLSEPVDHSSKANSHTPGR